MDVLKKSVLILLCFVSIQLSAQKIAKIEPPFWWTEMHNTKLELMVYGKNIAQLTPKITNKAITILGITKTENPNYLFIKLELKNAKAGVFTINFTKKNKVITHYNYQLKQREKDAALRKSFDSSDVIYLLMPDRFANGNPNNDSSPELKEKVDRAFKGGRHGGDIEGIIKHLDYLQELGVTAIWSTPLLEDNDERYSYHTYGQSDVYRIDPRYGTNEDYKRLATEMEKRGMKLIMDYVTNHWGAEHWMIKDLPTYTWIHQFPGYANSNYRMTTQFDPNASAIDKKYCMDGWFVPSMPDLNQSNPLVLTYLIQNAIWWIEYTGLDGFRVDTYSYNDKEAIAKWTRAITNEYPYFNIVGEVWMHNQAAIAYWQKDSKIGAIQSYNSYLPSVMDFTLHDAISSMFNEDNASWSNGMIKAYENFVNDYLYTNPNNLLVFAENHDTQRLHHLLNNDIQKYKLVMTLIATVRGIPQIYYGSEIGLTGNKDNGDGDIRKDFPGGWPSDTNNAFVKEGRTKRQQELFAFTSKLFQWRKQQPLIHTGKTTHYIPENNVYVYFRHNDKDAVMVVINNSVNPQTLQLSRFSESIKNHLKGKDILTGNTVDLYKGNILVKGKTSLILELE